MAGRDVVIGEQSDSLDDIKQVIVRRNLDTVMRIQALQVTLLLIVLIMLIVNSVRDDAADVDRHRLRATLDMYMLVNSQKDK